MGHGRYEDNPAATPVPKMAIRSRTVVVMSVMLATMLPCGGRAAGNTVREGGGVDDAMRAVSRRLTNGGGGRSTATSNNSGRREM